MVNKRKNKSIFAKISFYNIERFQMPWKANLIKTKVEG